MKNSLTAEDFLQDSLEISHFFDEKTNQMVCFSSDVQKAMIDFAKYHVEKALKEVQYSLTDGEVDEQLKEAMIKEIESVYPLENIK